MPQRLVSFLIVFSVAFMTFGDGIDAKEVELSPSGGIGNTRSDFESKWSLQKPIGDSFVYENQEYLMYDRGTFGVSVMYFLESDGKGRDTDRVGWFMLDYYDGIPMRSAQSTVKKYIPEDARQERSTKNMWNEPRVVYQSASAKEMFPELTVDGSKFEAKGEIWVTYGTMGLGNTVWAIEFGLYDDSVNRS